MRLCHIVPSLEERHGGPSKSVRALATQLARLGDSVSLLATAEAGSVGEPTAADAAEIRRFPRVAPRWLARSPGLAAYLRGTAFDCVHHHSLWLLTLRYARDAARRGGVPLVISPRGMLSGWAYRHHGRRKRLAELFVHPGAFQAAAGWHATSQEEADDIKALGFAQPVCVSPNGVELPADTALSAARTDWHGLCPPAAGRPVALFYSRFHRKKRVRELIDLWLAAPRGDWLLLLAGLADEFRATEVQGWITAAGAANRVAVFDGAGRPPPYAAASLLVLPSHSEKFGLVIAEALAAGVPVLTTDTTPWSGLAAQGCGWCVPWEHFGPTLARALATPPDGLVAMGRRGRDWVARDFSWNRTAGLLRDFYRQLRHEQK